MAKRICAWCGESLGEKDMKGAEDGDTHGICNKCSIKVLEEYESSEYFQKKRPQDE